MTLHARYLLDRRNFLGQTVTGLSGIALSELLARQTLAANEGKEPIRPDINPQQPNAVRDPHFAAKAKNVLVIFCAGACSHLDTWDYKPELIRMHDQPLPGDEKVIAVWRYGWPILGAAEECIYPEISSLWRQ